MIHVFITFKLQTKALEHAQHLVVQLYQAAAQTGPICTHFVDFVLGFYGRKEALFHTASVHCEESPPHSANGQPLNFWGFQIFNRKNKV